MPAPIRVQDQSDFAGDLHQQEFGINLISPVIFSPVGTDTNTLHRQKHCAHV
jgi:hypothetical protein